MKIAIIHYHLNRGGVTQVVANHLRALDQQDISEPRLGVALIHGGRCDGWSNTQVHSPKQVDVSMHAVEELDYDNVRPETDSLKMQLRSKLQKIGFEPHETVLHIHNHALGKNSELVEAIEHLASERFALLLHLHDFAEDFRPNNYRALTASCDADRSDSKSGLLYPQASQIHYAVLNQRDYSVLLDAGIESARLHLLPNAVAEIGPLPARRQARAKLSQRFGIPVEHRFVLYPVRGIRRKNLGEALLWSALAEKNTSFGLTLSPLNPVEQPSYDRWVKVAEQLKLSWAFRVGGPTGLGFTENLSASDLILSTSVAEGFGLGFLESWLAGRPIVGRDLPGITADFVAAGLRFPGLKPTLRIPVEWLDDDEFRRQFTTAYSTVLAAYGQPAPSRDSLREAVDSHIHDGFVDFGHCGSSLQQSVIERVVKNPSDRQRVLDANSWIKQALRDIDSSLIDRNAEIVRTQYSLESCGGRLLDIYRQTVSSDRETELQPLRNRERILNRFLDPSRFHPIRVES